MRYLYFVISSPSLNSWPVLLYRWDSVVLIVVGAQACAVVTVAGWMPGVFDCFTCFCSPFILSIKVPFKERIIQMYVHNNKILHRPFVRLTELSETKHTNTHTQTYAQSNRENTKYAQSLATPCIRMCAGCHVSSLVHFIVSSSMCVCEVICYVWFMISLIAVYM